MAFFIIGVFLAVIISEGDIPVVSFNFTQASYDASFAAHLV